MTGVGSTFNLALIGAYKKCRNLYDCEHPEYKVPMPTQKSWDKVAQECGATQVDCRIRWKALRDRYIKERKKNIQNPLNYHRKQWPLYEDLDFLKPFVENQRRKFFRGNTESMATHSNANSTRRSGYGQRNLSTYLPNNSGNEELDCSQDSVNFNEYEDKKSDFSTNFQVLQACEILERPDGNDALDKFLEGIDATVPLKTSSCEDESGRCSEQITATQQNQAKNDISVRKRMNDFSPQPASLSRRRRLDQSRIDSADESEISHANVLGCLRASVDTLAKFSQTFLEENEEVIFGRYIATVLSKMPIEERNRSKLQIFTILHSTNDNEPIVNGITKTNGEAEERN